MYGTVEQETPVSVEHKNPVSVCVLQCPCLSVDAMSILGPPAIQQWFAGLLIRGEVLVCEVLMQGVNVWKCVVKLMYGDVSQDKATNYI